MKIIIYYRDYNYVDTKCLTTEAKGIEERKCKILFKGSYTIYKVVKIFLNGGLGEQYFNPEISLWHMDYFELKTITAQKKETLTFPLTA